MSKPDNSQRLIAALEETAAELDEEARAKTNGEADRLRSQAERIRKVASDVMHQGTDGASPPQRQG